MRTQTTHTIVCILASFALTACGGGAYKSMPGAQRAANPEGNPDGYGGGSADAAEAYQPSAGVHRPGPAPEERPGLGTEFGENVVSHVTEKPFDRATTDPFAQVAIFYNDEDGVRAQAAYRNATLEAVRAYTPAGGISIALTDAYGRVLQGASASGRTYVIGEDGERYNLVITNDTGGRYEVVASVDGLDVIDGESASPNKRGYILGPYSTVTIDGFRTSDSTVAAFRFGAVGNSYAERKGQGRNVGVIGVAIFAEQGSQWTSDELYKRETADPFPNKYAQPPPR